MKILVYVWKHPSQPWRGRTAHALIKPRSNAPITVELTEAVRQPSSGLSTARRLNGRSAYAIAKRFFRFEQPEDFRVFEDGRFCDPPGDRKIL